MTQQELEQLLQANQESLSRIELDLKKVKKQMLWAKIGGVLKIVLILGPIIYGVIYLSPMLKKYAGGLQTAFSILGSGVPANIFDNQQNVNSEGNSIIDSQSLEVLCDPQLRQSVIEQVCK
ncbi:hypothetical protein H6761_00455 [Candidatus Nomurabacteria bacterium]|nr:hypothetical protein [Candidatus Nomurabacteria bacterium]